MQILWLYFPFCHIGLTTEQVNNNSKKGSSCKKNNTINMSDIEKKGFEMDLIPVSSGTKSGDCIAMRYGDLVKGGINQVVIVIDGGYASTADKLKRHLQEYYNCVVRGKLHVDCIILSHPDQDHIAGLVKLLEDDDISVGCIVAFLPWEEMTLSWFKDGRITPNSLEKRLEDSFGLLKQFQDTANEKKIDIIGLKELNRTCECDGATFKFLGPDEKFYKACIANCDKTPSKDPSVPNVGNSFSANDKYEEETYVEGEIEWFDKEGTSPINESSIILLFEYDGVKILFCGDAGKDALNRAIEYAEANDIDLSNISVIKMPHHGSRKNVDPKLMDKLYSPGCSCYITCAPGDEGHHPSKRLVNMLLEKGFKVFSTSGNTLHRKHNSPEREGWKTVYTKTPYHTIEK